jgi:tol-pal system protein YbgF
MKACFAVFLCLAVFIPSISFAKTPDERISSVEVRIDEIQKTYLSNSQNAASAIASIDSIREDWNQMKGQIDANRHMMEVSQQDLTKMMGDLDHRIQAIEERLQVFSNQLSKALSKVAPEVAAEGDMYQGALDLMSEAKYLEAAAMLEKFLKKYERSPYSASATFFVGESFYSMRDYQRAVKEFQRYVEKYPRDKNVPSAILKQGNCFYELGMLEEAKAFYDKVSRGYSQSSEAIQAKEKLMRINEKQIKGAQGPSNTLSSYPIETIEQRQTRMKAQPSPAVDATPEKIVPKSASDGDRF